MLAGPTGSTVNLTRRCAASILLPKGVGGASFHESNVWPRNVPHCVHSRGHPYLDRGFTLATWMVRLIAGGCRRASGRTPRMLFKASTGSRSASEEANTDRPPKRSACLRRGVSPVACAAPRGRRLRPARLGLPALSCMGERGQWPQSAAEMAAALRRYDDP